MTVTGALAGCGGSSESIGSADETVTTGLTEASPSVSGSPAATALSTASVSSSSSGTTQTSGSSNSSSSSAEPIGTSDTVTLLWSAPSENINGTALTNLAGYEIYYGTSLTAMTNKITINTVGMQTYVISNLYSGTWYFEVIAVNASGIESNPSAIVSTII
jgi:hypothetical protein